MNPAVPDDNNGIGSSFEGVVTYMMHDKRTPGISQPNTSNRVGGTACDNLFADDPDEGWREMASTYYSADEIKRRNHEAAQASLKAAQRKPYRSSKPVKNSVLHYALSWCGEKEAKPSFDHMLETARASLSALGGADHQAIFVEHTDTPNPHIHIIASRIDPNTGLVKPLESNIKKKLSRFALKYNKAHGTEHLAPQRAINAEKRKQGLSYDAEARLPRGMYEDERAASPEIAAKPALAQRLKAEQRAKDRAMYEADRKREARHGNRLSEIERSHLARVAAIKTEASASKRQVTKLIDEEFQTKWNEIWGRMESRTAEMLEAERTASGRFKNTMQALGELWQSSDPETTRSIMRKAYQVVMDRNARLDAIGTLRGNQVNVLAAQQRKAIAKAHAEIDEATTSALMESHARREVEIGSAEITATIDRDRSAKAWQIRKAERRGVWKDFIAQHRRERITEPERLESASERVRRNFEKNRKSPDRDHDPEAS